jgi:arylsulfatase A-like enzyme
MGFEHFYGFIGGETNQWYPALYEGTTPVEPAGTPEEGYSFNDDLTDHTITWIRQQKALMPDKPFFIYFAPGATHAPHHVPKEWADRYKGKFDQGWDKLREETFAHQKQLGVIPEDCDLTVRSPGTCNGTIVHWPRGIQAKGQVRSQFHHVIDVPRPSWRWPGCPTR